MENGILSKLNYKPTTTNVVFSRSKKIISTDDGVQCTGSMKNIPDC